MNYHKSLTIMIPTMNRSAYIARSLNYYSSVDYQGYICIGDASDGEEADKNQTLITSLSNRLNIIYVPCPISSAGEIDPLGTPGEGICIKELIEHVPTEYTAISGDDDFLIPYGTDKCIKYLEENPDIIAAQGIRVSFQPRDRGPHGEIASTKYALPPNLATDSATDRWISYMRDPYTPLYAVHRTDSWRRLFKDFGHVPMRYLGSELLPAGIMTILGKSIELDVLSIVTQSQQDRLLSHASNSMYASLMHPYWGRSIQSFRRLIIEALNERAQEDTQIVEYIVDRELWAHIILIMRSQYTISYGEHARNTIGSLREIVKHFPLMETLYRKMTARTREPKRIRDNRRAATLKSLLKPSSPFHADFMPVYRAVVNGPST